MQRAPAQPEKRLAVDCCSIALVAGKPIPGVFQIHPAHQGITGGFCQDGRGCHAQAATIPFDKPELGDFQLGKEEVISEQAGWSETSQSTDCSQAGGG